MSACAAQQYPQIWCLQFDGRNHLLTGGAPEAGELQWRLFWHERQFRPKTTALSGSEIGLRGENHEVADAIARRSRREDLRHWGAEVL